MRLTSKRLIEEYITLDVVDAVQLFPLYSLACRHGQGSQLNRVHEPPSKQKLQAPLTICADENREIQGEERWRQPPKALRGICSVLGFCIRFELPFVAVCRVRCTLVAPLSAADVAPSGTTEGGTLVQPYLDMFSDPVRIQKLPVPVASRYFFSTAVTFRVAGSR
jgi:hypothetical protein